VSVGLLVAKYCDKYVHSKCASYKADTLQTIIATSKCCKARLLHYFPVESDCSQLFGSDSPAGTDDNTTITSSEASSCVQDNTDIIDNNNDSSSWINNTSPISDDDNAFSSWCGWHNDHGALTGLTAAMLLDDSTGEPVSTLISTNNDGDDHPAVSTSGLYARNRKGELVKITIPEDCIAFQIGETAQILSGGILQATPHAVRATEATQTAAAAAAPPPPTTTTTTTTESTNIAESSTSGMCNTTPTRGSTQRRIRISRETFAVFMEPMWDYPMKVPGGINPLAAQSQAAAKNLPPGVPPIAIRWNNDMLFGEFTDSTLAAYH
jgi:hypothetical protein